MRGISEGELCGAYDDLGVMRSVCIFIKSHDQWTLSHIDDVGYWNYEVLQDGQVKYLSTRIWTLIPLNKEES